MADDGRWEYDCPQYIDFTEPMPFNDGADKLFEKTVIGEGLPRVESTVDEGEPNTLLVQEEKPKKKRPSNLVCSLEEWRNPGKHASSGPADEASEKKKMRKSAEKATVEMSKGFASMSGLKRSGSVRLLKSNSVSSLTSTELKPERIPTGGISAGRIQIVPKEGSQLQTECLDTDSKMPKFDMAAGSNILNEASEKKKMRKSAEKATVEMSKGFASMSGLKRSGSVRLLKSNSVSSLTSIGRENTSTRSSTELKPERIPTGGTSAGRIQIVPKEGSQLQTECLDTDSKMPKFDMAAGSNILKCLTESATSSKVKSSEELELERINQLKKELQHKRQMAKESYKKAMTATAYVVPHAVKEPTIPQEFHFQTDTRLKKNGEEKKPEESTVTDFVRMLRSRTVISPKSSSSSGPKLYTLPQPFHLTEKSKPVHCETKFESLAEKINAFHRRTPERFRVRPNSSDRSRRRSRSFSPPKVTIPHTPNLQAHGRHRPITVLSQKELEDREVEEMKKNQFKARPINTRILSNPNLGVKKVPTKPPTEPEEFTLSANLRKKDLDVKSGEKYEFHAQPINKKILEGPVGVVPVKPALPTVPMSPAFALKHRARLPVEVPEEKPDTSVIKAKPVPHTGIPFQPKLPHQHTVPEPFSVETRSKMMLAQKEDKIKQILEEEKRAREFHAQPLPPQEPGPLPPKMTKEPTVPNPFQLATDIRGSQYSEEFARKTHSTDRVHQFSAQNQMKEEEEELHKAAIFKAQPNVTVYMDPFVPAKSNKPLTEVSNIELNSERRAIQREDFELRKKEKEAELEGHRRQREQRQKEEEEAAVAKLRAEMVHRSNPVRHYAPVILKPSDKPLTKAESPNFSERLRTKERL